MGRGTPEGGYVDPNSHLSVSGRLRPRCACDLPRNGLFLLVGRSVPRHFQGPMVCSVPEHRILRRSRLFLRRLPEASTFLTERHRPIERF